MNDAYRKGLRAALKAIADLPTPKGHRPERISMGQGEHRSYSEYIVEGQENATRAIEVKLK